ncbi:MAG: Flp pilus assembly complex ATPase component TadA [Cellulosilyticum sp.]|nr:Flp pilus assembly complex ATPase component TadA [Cellulosilyticum sp.]
MLEIKNITYEISDRDEKKKILDDISLQIEKGKILVITGPNGSGKSTLAKILMGIIQPTDGEILLNGENITECSVTDRAQKGMGYTFQQPPRFKGITVKKLLEIAAGETLNEESCCEYLSEVGICAKDYLNREADAALSGGEMKRIEIATQLIRNSEYTIFDEPEAGIDLWSFSMLVKTFNRLKEKGNRGLIIISHQEKLIQMADEIMVLTDGKITKKGKADVILEQLHCDKLTC